MPSSAHNEAISSLEEIDLDQLGGADHHPSAATGFSDAEIQALLTHIDTPEYYTDEEITEILSIVQELEQRQRIGRIRDDLIEFCKHMQPDYIVGRHHRILGNMLMDIAHGREDRICVNIPPRHGKSQLDSIYFPAWFLGHFPDKKVMMVSHTTDLAVDFGRKVRNLIASDAYKEIFPDTSLSADSKSAGRWNTNHKAFLVCSGLSSKVMNVIIYRELK